MGTEQLKELKRLQKENERLIADMIELTRQYGRYGYRRVTALMRSAGWPPFTHALNVLPGSE